MSGFCRVSGCRYATTHVSRGHWCRKCGTFGHGVRECGNLRAMQAVARAVPARVPFDACSVSSCRAAETHTTEAHYCTTCHVRGGGGVCCPIDVCEGVQCPHCRAQTIIIQENVFTGSDCTVCYESGPLTVLACGHALVCISCLRQYNP